MVILWAQIQKLSTQPTRCLSFVWTTRKCCYCKEAMGPLLCLSDTLQNCCLRKEKQNLCIIWLKKYVKVFFSTFRRNWRTLQYLDSKHSFSSFHNRGFIWWCLQESLKNPSLQYWSPQSIAQGPMLHLAMSESSSKGHFCLLWNSLVFIDWIGGNFHKQSLCFKQYPSESVKAVFLAHVS